MDQQSPSLPEARSRFARLRCGGRECKFHRAVTLYLFIVSCVWAFGFVGPIVAEEKKSTFHLTDGRKTVTIVSPTRTADYDLMPAAINSLLQWGPAWDPTYTNKDVGYTIVNNGEIVNEYKVVKNTPTHRQLCGGLAFARLFGGPHLMVTEIVYEVVDKFAVRGEPAQPGDIVVFYNGPTMTGKSVGHYALVVEDGNIISKNGPQRIYRGELKKFPEFQTYSKETVRIPWDEIDVVREGDKVTPLTLPVGAPVDWLPENTVRRRDRKAIIDTIAGSRPGFGTMEYHPYRVAATTGAGTTFRRNSVGDVGAADSIQKKVGDDLPSRRWSINYCFYDSKEAAKAEADRYAAERELVGDAGKPALGLAGCDGYYRLKKSVYGTPNLTSGNGGMVTRDEAVLLFARCMITIECSSTRINLDGRTEDLWKQMVANDRDVVQKTISTAYDKAIEAAKARPERPVPFQLD